MICTLPLLMIAIVIVGRMVFGWRFIPHAIISAIVLGFYFSAWRSVCHHPKTHIGFRGAHHVPPPPPLPVSVEGIGSSDFGSRGSVHPVFSVPDRVGYRHRGYRLQRGDGHVLPCWMPDDASLCGYGFVVAGFDVQTLLFSLFFAQNNT